MSTQRPRFFTMNLKLPFSTISFRSRIGMCL